MFYCKECLGEFENPLIFFERHGLFSAPFEKIFCCPFCKGMLIFEKKRGEENAE